MEAKQAKLKSIYEFLISVIRPKVLPFFEHTEYTFWTCIYKRKTQDKINFGYSKETATLSQIGQYGIISHQTP